MHCITGITVRYAQTADSGQTTSEMRLSAAIGPARSRLRMSATRRKRTWARRYSFGSHAQEADRLARHSPVPSADCAGPFLTFGPGATDGRVQPFSYQRAERGATVCSRREGRQPLRPVAHLIEVQSLALAAAMLVLFAASARTLLVPPNFSPCRSSQDIRDFHQGRR